MGQTGPRVHCATADSGASFFNRAGGIGNLQIEDDRPDGNRVPSETAQRLPEQGPIPGSNVNPPDSNRGKEVRENKGPAGYHRPKGAARPRVPDAGSPSLDGVRPTVAEGSAGDGPRGGSSDPDDHSEESRLPDSQGDGGADVPVEAGTPSQNDCPNHACDGLNVDAAAFTVAGSNEGNEECGRALERALGNALDPHCLWPRWVGHIALVIDCADREMIGWRLSRRAKAHVAEVALVEDVLGPLSLRRSRFYSTV